MSNIAVVLRDEIRRLARREIKSEIQKTRRITARYRGDIAQLKRTIRLQQRRLASLESRKPQPAGDVEAEQVAPGSRFSARSVRAQRKRLGVSAEQYAKIIGVSPQTIYLWERGKVRPKASQFAALIEARSLGRREVQSRLDQAGKRAATRAKPARTKAKR